MERKPRSSNAKAELPKARAFILDRLAKLVEGIFQGSLSTEGALAYAMELEESMFELFKDGQGEKAVAGARYK